MHIEKLPVINHERKIIKDFQIKLEYNDNEQVHTANVLEGYTNICIEHLMQDEDQEIRSILEWEKIIWDLLHTLFIDKFERAWDYSMRFIDMDPDYFIYINENGAADIEDRLIKHYKALLHQVEVTYSSSIEI